MRKKQQKSATSGHYRQECPEIANSSFPCGNDKGYNINLYPADTDNNSDELKRELSPTFVNDDKN